jgi:uncharacterized 2Fe-2S/4Fe-4S cluster protein (DUF4445 family)
MTRAAAGFPVIFLPAGREGACGRQETLLEAGQRLGVRIASACGGLGRCDSCAVRVEGEAPAPSQEDRELFDAGEIAAGWRRACTARASGPCVVHVPARTAAASVARGQEGARSTVPIAEPVVLPSAEGWRRIDGTRIEGPGRPVGLAVDVGTTNLAAALVDLATGEVLATAAKGNPQGAWGADVISRLERALHAEATRRDLARAVLSAIEELGSELTDGAPRTIQEVSLVGNTVMQHLLLGLPVEGLARAPYRPEALDAVERSAAELGLFFARGARVRCGPNIGGFVGSDHVAALLEVLADPPAGTWALVDIGTNTEITLSSGGRRTAVSCASGPAFEGWRLTCGVPAGEGAIDKVQVSGNGVELETIGGAPPTGLCGSGVLSLLAGLRRAGAVDARGALSRRHPLVRERDGEREILLVERPHDRPLVFTQDDVRTIQLTKAAIRAGFDLLLAEHGVAEEGLDAVLVAGAFGRFLDLDVALAIGLFPALPAERFFKIGNAAADGAAHLLACAAARRRAGEIAREVRHLEPAADPGFQKTFLRRTSL